MLTKRNSNVIQKKTSKEKPNQNEKIANTVVYEYLKNHQKPGVRQLALELQKEVPVLLDEKVPSLQELYPAVARRKNFTSSQKEGVKPESKAIEWTKVLTTNYSYGSAEKVVPIITDVFQNRLKEIQVFRQDKPEVYKVLKYILNSDTKVMKAQADTIETRQTWGLQSAQIHLEQWY